MINCRIYKSSAFQTVLLPPDSHNYTQYVLRPFFVSLPLTKPDVTSAHARPSTLTSNRTRQLVAPENFTACIEHRHGGRGGERCPFDVFKPNNSFFKTLGSCTLHFGLNYELIYQLNAIEYLFVFFQLDMFRAYTPIFRSNGC